ncbi:MAG TPA: hypothetical protein VH372_03370 [Actinospica sp.]|nr:hypothetical protein [Actinospica sp.]
MFAEVFWVRAALAAVYVGVPASLVGASVWWATRRTGHGASAGPAAAVRRARLGRLAGLGVGAAAGIVSIWFGQGLPAPALVAIGYLFGVLKELLSVPPPSGTVRTAVVRTREAGRYLPRWAVWVAVGTGAICVLTPLLFAVLPRVRYAPWSPDGGDPRFTAPGGTLSWPAAGTSVPLAAIAVLGVLAGSLLAHRIALLPALVPDPIVDEKLRCRIARAGAGAVIGIELLTLAASVIAASSGLAVPGAVGGTDRLASRILVWAGVGLAAGAVLAWCVLGSRRLARVTVDVAGRAADA